MSWSVNQNGAWTLEAGHNTANRRDFGKHDNEKGGGFGFGTGYRQYFRDGLKGFYAEAILETWFLTIDWENTSPAESGQTNISVLQPTIGAGYQFRSQSDMWAATIGITLGREWNMKTEGDPVGEGGISLLAFSITRRL